MPDRCIDSLRRRIRTLHLLWDRALTDMTLEQINRQERPGVLPIAFSLVHTLRTEDHAVQHWLLGRAPLWERDGWADRVGVAVDRQGTGEAVERMEGQRLGDLASWAGYQAAVFEATHALLDVINAATLAEVVLPAVPATAGGFWALFVGAGNPLTKLDVLECWVYQHGLRHLGELEHARALVGLGGLAG